MLDRDRLPIGIGATDWTLSEPHRGLREILLRWDPIGVGSNPHAADEYDCLIPTLSRLLHDGSGEAAIARYLESELQSHFGLSTSAGGEATVAAEIVHWWQEPQPGPPVGRPLTLEDLRLTLARVSVEEQDNQKLPTIAAWALVGGLDSPSLSELAGESGDDVRQCRDLFVDALDELGVTLPDPTQGYMSLAVYWAREMLAGVLTPYEASRLIWWRAWSYNGRPHELVGFVSLASQWEDDPASREAIERNMRAEAAQLVQRFEAG